MLKFSSRSFPAYISGFNWVGGHNLAPGGGNWAVCPAPNHLELYLIGHWLRHMQTIGAVQKAKRFNVVIGAAGANGVFAQISDGEQI